MPLKVFVINPQDVKPPKALTLTLKVYIHDTIITDRSPIHVRLTAEGDAFAV